MKKLSLFLFGFILIVSALSMATDVSAESCPVSVKDWSICNDSNGIQEATALNFSDLSICPATPDLVRNCTKSVDINYNSKFDHSEDDIGNSAECGLAGVTEMVAPTIGQCRNNAEIIPEKGGACFKPGTNTVADPNKVSGLERRYCDNGSVRYWTCKNPSEVCRNGIDDNCNGQIDEGCLSCVDGIQNQGETGIDCGGPCSVSCESSCSQVPITKSLELITPYFSNSGGTCPSPDQSYACYTSSVGKTLPCCAIDGDTLRGWSSKCCAEGGCNNIGDSKLCDVSFTFNTPQKISKVVIKHGAGQDYPPLMKVTTSDGTEIYRGPGQSAPIEINLPNPKMISNITVSSLAVVPAPAIRWRIDEMDFYKDTCEEEEDLTASCYGTPNPVNDPPYTVNWIATSTGGTVTPTYSWSGTDGLSGTGDSLAKTYVATGTKQATVLVTSGTATTSVNCYGSVTNGGETCTDNCGVCIGDCDEEFNGVCDSGRNTCSPGTPANPAETDTTYIWDCLGSDDTIITDDVSCFVLKPIDPEHNPELDCTAISSDLSSPVNVNTMVNLTAETSSLCPTCVNSWSVNDGDFVSGNNPWPKIFTTVGVKNITFKQTDLSANKYGTCTGTITIVQTGGGSQEI